MELLHDKYLNEEPLPAPVYELRIPSTNHAQNEGSPGGWWCGYKDMDSDSDFEEFGNFNVTTTDAGFSDPKPLTFIALKYTHFKQNYPSLCLSISPPNSAIISCFLMIFHSFKLSPFQTLKNTNFGFSFFFIYHLKNSNNFSSPT